MVVITSTEVVETDLKYCEAIMSSFKLIMI